MGRFQHSQDSLEKEAKDIAKRIERLLAAIEDGGDAPSLVSRVRDLEQRQRDEMTALRPVPRLAPQIIDNRLAEWRRLLRSSITQGRAVLQRILKGRIVFTPEGDGYTFKAQTRFDTLFEGIAVPLLSAPEYVANGTGRGLERVEAQYNDLLERAQRNYDTQPRNRKGVVALEAAVSNRLADFLLRTHRLRATLPLVA